MTKSLFALHEDGTEMYGIGEKPKRTPRHIAAAAAVEPVLPEPANKREVRKPAASLRRSLHNFSLLGEQTY